MNKRQQLGREAEEEAANYLLSLGYSLITRRYKVRQGEIDLICLDGNTIVFVEVKARMAPGFSPEESIGKEKMDHLRWAAHEYLTRHEEKRHYRFDVIAMDIDGLRHHRHIFNR